MEEKSIGEALPIEKLIKCLEDREEVFAVYEDLTNNTYSIIAWGYKDIISGSDEDILTRLENVIRKLPADNDIKSINEGVIGYVSYDIIRLWERVRDIKPFPEKWPYIEFFKPENIIVYDYVRRKLYIDVIDDKLLNCDLGFEDDVRVKHYDSSPECRKFKNDVDLVLKYIRDGYVFQAVLSRFERYVYRGNLSKLYLTLRRLNPSPYTYYIRFKDRVLIGSSPELLFSLNSNVIETYPIAGTRPRGLTYEEDLRLEKELLQSEKDRAEHLMLVDLARNDVGKVSSPGTVRVEKLMYVEKYSHVQHIVSKVVGVPRRKSNVIDVLKAMVPAGTVSGAPKVFVMNLIEDLEEFKRGPYAGAVGFITSLSNAIMAITIRTAFINKEILRIQAGAGIVHDSKPELEYEETEHKLKALKTALDIVSGGT